MFIAICVSSSGKWLFMIIAYFSIGLFILMIQRSSFCIIAINILVSDKWLYVEHILSLFMNFIFPLYDIF